MYSDGWFNHPYQGRGFAGVITGGAGELGGTGKRAASLVVPGLGAG